MNAIGGVWFFSDLRWIGQESACFYNPFGLWTIQMDSRGRARSKRALALMERLLRDVPDDIRT